ncbi:MAG: hypothetical protein JNM07_11665 [Phycisphaerae bacterium]|nr:hypothetical protein [Phycisphaerae bacterium]
MNLTQFRIAARRSLLSALILLPAACASKPELVAPQVLVAPYDSANGPSIWAIAPLRNESGTSAADPLKVTDTITARVAEVRGISVVPLNRTLAAMRTLGMSGIDSPAAARRLAESMGVDAVIIGSITAYDPYDPPSLGLTLALYSRPTNLTAATIGDSRTMSAAGSEAPGRGGLSLDPPVTVVAEHLDAKNHAVLMQLKNYAEGRHDPSSALAWRRYTASMDLFCEFAAYRTVGRLLDEERLRIARSVVNTRSAATASASTK